jgi:hypothetical protein
MSCKAKENNVSKDISYALTHVVILKFFVVWGILETVLYFLTGGDKRKELVIHVLILLTITASVYLSPDLMDHIMT